MWMLQIAITLIWMSLLADGRPSLSDPLGMMAKKNPYNLEMKSTDYVHGSIWPKPQSEKPKNQLFSLDPGHFEFKITGKVSDVIEDAVFRYKGLTFPDPRSKVAVNSSLIMSLEVQVETDYEPIDLDSDESYMLDINSPKSTLRANTCWGALRGLETFSQAVYQDTDGKYYAQGNSIADFPRFKHRGFLIDTSRHYLSVEIIMKFLDAMSYSKFNVLHWHIVDDPSFPYESSTYPELHLQGAWDQNHVYTASDIKSIIEYARLRGIRIIPEFDSPGHTQSWKSIPDLLTTCYSGDRPNGLYGPIDPTVDKNYDFLRNFFGEIAHVFPDKYLHMGGDEVSFACWQSNPNITKWMEEKNITGNYSLLEQYYEQELLKIVGKLNKGYIVWQEVFDNGVQLAEDTVVNLWLNWKADTPRITAKGYRTILSSPWYLNYISYGPDWPKYYNVDPHDFNGTAAQKELVIGGTACMWGEMVDGTNIISRTWGRGLSVGERLWSSKETKDIGDATKRIWEHRCRYLRRGLQAENVVQSEYCRHEWMSTH